MGTDIDIERKKELDRERAKVVERKREKEGEEFRKMEKEGGSGGGGEIKKRTFSVACVLDAPLGALLLYYLPHSLVQEEGEERVKEMMKEEEEERVKEKEKEEEKERVKEIKKLNVKARVRLGVDGMRGEADEGEEDGEHESKHEKVLPFCVIDLVWLLQLKDRDSTSDNSTSSSNLNINSNNNAQNSTNNIIKRLNSPNMPEIQEGKLNEKSANYHYNTTIKIKETVDRAFFMKNTLIVITKTISRKIQHQNDRISSVKVPDPNVQVDKKMTGTVEKRNLVEKKRRNSFDLKNYNDGDEDDSGGDYDKRDVNFDNSNKGMYDKNRNSSSSSGSGSGSEKGSARGSARNSERGGGSRSHTADNSGELKVIGGTIYVLNFTGKWINIIRYTATLYPPIFIYLSFSFLPS